MKKLVQFIVSALLILVLSASAMAEVTYSDGVLTVSQSASGIHTIVLDGQETGYWVDDQYGDTSFRVKLADGQHVVSFTTVEGSGRASETFWVGTPGVPTEEPTEEPTEAPTEEPTAEPTVAPTEEPTDPTEAPTEEPAADPTEAPKAEPTQAPVTVPTAEPVLVPEEAVLVKPVVVEIAPECNKEGKANDGTVIPARGHRYLFEVKTVTEEKYRCADCGKTIHVGLNQTIQNRLGNIVKDEKGAVLNYQGSSNNKDAALYTIKVDNPKGIALLYLDNQVIAQLIREGYQRLAFINGNAELVITLKNIGAKWFNTADVINTYIFQTDAAAKQETTVVISALTDKEQVFANLFDGVTLNGAPIEKNGTY